MRSTITADVEVDVPISVAYNQWTQFESFPEFMTGIETVDQIDDRNLHWRVNMGGVEREFDATITEQVPNDHIAWISTDEQMHAGKVSFHRVDDNCTHVDLKLEWEPDSFMEKAGAALKVDKLMAKNDLNKFKKFIEERGRETGAWRGEIPESGTESGPLM